MRHSTSPPFGNLVDGLPHDCQYLDLHLSEEVSSVLHGLLPLDRVDTETFSVCHRIRISADLREDLRQDLGPAEGAAGRVDFYSHDPHERGLHRRFIVGGGEPLLRGAQSRAGAVVVGVVNYRTNNRA